MKYEDLKDSPNDYLLSLVKGGAGMIPVVGAIVSEMIGSTIPNQRLDRVAAFLTELGKRLDELEFNLIHENVYLRDLFEDAMLQASRALSEERNKYLAQFVKNTLYLPEDSHSVQKKLLYILQELTDKDIEFLVTLRDYGFYQARQPFNLPTPTQNELLNPNRDFMTTSLGLHIHSLERLDLVRLEYALEDEEFPESNIDAYTGLKEITECEITKIGTLLLSTIQV
ncbi:hypothetical protein A165_11130 [Vibrio tasmaniensis ZS-17]|uniref:hypothetical protein n=1 Tax=Vibrio tasmaniensis TaxID=212663 RepID=UPI0002F77E7B|nr:hypothetical protein [Vibrio tasmaniensis]OED64320.1 hypothetical protein A165_11130 [Vibrio tasmaniensis ZS-17]